MQAYFLICIFCEKRISQDAQYRIVLAAIDYVGVIRNAYLSMHICNRTA